MIALDPVLTAFLLGTVGGPLGGLAAAFGGSAVMRRLTPHTRGAVLALAGGFILAVTFLELLVPALEGAEGWAILLVLGGLALGGGLRSLIVTVLDTSESAQNLGDLTYGHRQARRIAFSVAIVNILEGIPVGIGFIISPALGLLLGAIMIFENFTEGLTIVAELSGDPPNMRRMLLLTTAPAITLGLGGATGVFLGEVSPDLLGLLFGSATGIMLYLVVDDIIYDAQSLDHGAITALPLIGGVILGAAVTALT